MKRFELKELIKEVVLNEFSRKQYKQYKYIVKALKELKAKDEQIEYILSLVDDLETTAWRKGAREGFQR